MDEAALVKLPVANRRGVWLNDCGNTWFSILFARGMDAVSSGLEGRADVGLVRRDVTGEVLDGKLPAPDGRWALLVELVGSDWVHFAAPETLHPFHRDFELGNKLAAELGLRVLTTGYEDCSCATFVDVREGDRQVLRFESTGEDFSGEEVMSPGEMDEEDFEDWDGSCATTFKSETHPPDWWKQFESEDEVHQALLTELEAYVPFVQALPSEEGKVELFACHEDAVQPESIRRIDLVVFGDAKLAKPNAANAQLAEAIKEGNGDAVRAAIAAGADVAVLKNATITPLAYAIDLMRIKEPQRIEVIRTLLEAGADPDAGGGSNNDSPLIKAIGKTVALPALAIEVVELLLDAGADVKGTGKGLIGSSSSPLHCAVNEASLAAVRLLLSRGADLQARDGSGNTPIKKARTMIKSLHEILGEEMEGEQISSYQKIVEYLEKVEKGGEIGDPQQTVAIEQAAADSKHRRMAVEGARFKKKMNEFGKLFQQANEETRQKVETSLLAQPDSISLRSCKKADWADAKPVEADTKKLKAKGFTQVGDFHIDEIQGTLIRGFVNPEKCLVAAIGQTSQGVTWCDVVRFHGDGSALTATTTSYVDGMHHFETPEFQKLHCADESISYLLSEIRAVRPRAEPVAVVVDQFAERFESYYAEDIAVKKSRCRNR